MFQTSGTVCTKPQNRAAHFLLLLPTPFYLFFDGPPLQASTSLSGLTICSSYRMASFWSIRCVVAFASCLKRGGGGDKSWTWGSNCLINRNICWSHEELISGVHFQGTAFSGTLSFLNIACVSNSQVVGQGSLLAHGIFVVKLPGCWWCKVRGRASVKVTVATCGAPWEKDLLSWIRNNLSTGGWLEMVL